MKSVKGSPLGGLMMLVALVAMLCVPIGIGYYNRASAPDVSLHASAEVK